MYIEKRVYWLTLLICVLQRLDGKLAVNNDGNHASRERTGCVSNLERGWHKIVLTFYNGGGKMVMQASARGGGFDWTPVSTEWANGIAMTKP